MGPKLLLHLLTARPRTAREAGFTMLAGILVILALLVGTLGLVAIVNGANLGTFGSGEARDSQQVAEAGADQIIATFNQPENRQLLVAGSTPPSQWSTTNEALQSPCVSNTDKRPGANNDGYPTAQAVSFADGKFRNLENIAQTSTGTRQFLLKSIRYSAGSPGDTNRRSIYVGYKADGSALTTGGTIPSGTSFNSLINLDPGSGSTTAPGGNTGFIAVEVEGRLYRANGTYSTTTITREYEVLPKCCGGSFGTQGSGGSPTGVPFGSAGSTGALGADSRFCGIEFGLITGINNGRFWSQQVDRRYTRVSTTGKVVNVSAIIGIIAKPTYKWDRTTSQTDGVVVQTTAGPQTITQQVGCRTIPSACNVSTDINPSSGAQIPPFYSNMINIGFAAGVCGPNVPLFTGNPNQYSPTNKSFGDKASFDGRSASCVPIFPLYLSTGLPSVSSKYFLPLGWTPNGNPATVAASSVTSDAPGAYPQITFISSVDTATSAAQNGVWIRANRATSVRQATAGAGGGPTTFGTAPYLPFVEYCNTKYLPSNACQSITNGSNKIHTWALISQTGNLQGGNPDRTVIGGISDDFSSYSNLSALQSGVNNGGFTPGSTPRWPSLWTTSANGTLNPSTPATISVNKSVTFCSQPTSCTGSSPTTATWTTGATAPWLTSTNAPAIARAVNLYALQTPVLEITFSVGNSSALISPGPSALSLDYSFTSPITTDQAVNIDTGWVQLAALSGKGAIAASNGATAGTPGGTAGTCTGSGTSAAPYVCRIGFPLNAFRASNPMYTTGVTPAPSTNRFTHYVKFRLRANSNFGAGSSTQISSVTINNVAVLSDTSSPNNPALAAATNPSGASLPRYQNWCEYNSAWPNTTRFTLGGFHCLGPYMYMPARFNNVKIDSTDGSISLYYNSNTDNRGNSATRPVINLTNGGLIANVQCGRSNATTTTPSDNCTSNIPSTTYADVGEHDFFNIFGRDTAPGLTCSEMGLSNQPCNQYIVVGTDPDNATNPSKISGIWFYMPWGYIAFNSALCSPLPAIPFNTYFPTDDSWNISGRVWVRTIHACGQNHFRVPPSSSSNLAQLSGANSTDNVSILGWSGNDWVARSPSATQRWFSLN